MFGVVISDTGVGISEKSIANVFERYFRISETWSSISVPESDGLG